MDGITTRLGEALLKSGEYLLFSVSGLILGFIAATTSSSHRRRGYGGLSRHAHGLCPAARTPGTGDRPRPHSTRGHWYSLSDLCTESARKRARARLVVVGTPCSDNTTAASASSILLDERPETINLGSCPTFTLSCVLIMRVESLSAVTDC